MRPIPLIIFAKVPEPGTVKTRLMPHCNAQQAAEIAKILLHTSVANAARNWPGDVVLAVWPDVDHPFIQHLADSYSLRVIRQCRGDLGQKMHDALVQTGFPAAVAGADVPHIAEKTFQTAHALLITGQHVIGPSRDGGYYLLGLSSDVPNIFEQIDWGTSSVLRQTIEQMSAENELNRLDKLFDVDEWEDVIAIADLVTPLQKYLSEQALL